MEKQSTRENKTIYQQYREEQGLTREKASQEMTGVSASRIEKIEYELQEPTLTTSSRWLTAISILTYAIITVLTSV